MTRFRDNDRDKFRRIFVIRFKLSRDGKLWSDAFFFRMEQNGCRFTKPRYGIDRNFSSTGMVGGINRTRPIFEYFVDDDSRLIRHLYAEKIRQSAIDGKRNPASGRANLNLPRRIPVHGKRNRPMRSDALTTDRNERLRDGLARPVHHYRVGKPSGRHAYHSSSSERCPEQMQYLLRIQRNGTTIRRMQFQCRGILRLKKSSPSGRTFVFYAISA